VRSSEPIKNMFNDRAQLRGAAGGDRENTRPWRLSAKPAFAK
jgi:hypothetical protein